MAINSPHGEKANERPSASNDSEDARDKPGESQTGVSTEMLFEENKDRGTSSNLSSQENLASAASSPFPFSSPRASSDPSPSQPDSPVSSPHLHSSSLLSSSSSLPSPYQQNANISVEQLNELALQDSANNNVDENSNQGFDQYAQVSQEYVPNQSVRPRIRASHGGRDQPDRAPVSFEPRVRRRSRSNSFSHRRNLSEDLACSPTTNFPFSFDDDQDRYPENDRLPLPRLPNYQERRNDWSCPQPLPRSDASFLQSVTRILPLNLRGGGYGPQRPPEPENIENDAHDLLCNFTSETLRRNCPQSDPSLLPQGFRNPALYSVGRELRHLADAFAETEERRRVQHMAERVHLESINMENFFQLCTELFMDGITRERIVALFTFIGDVAVYHVRRQGYQCLQVLMKWSLKYLVEHICIWVKQSGGWGAVLSKGANALYKSAVIAFCMIGTIAAGVYIMKTLKDW